MTVPKTMGGKKTKSQRGKRSNKRKTQKGGWSFFGPSDPNAPKNTGFFSSFSLFGSSKKPEAVNEVPNPLLTESADKKAADDAAAAKAAADAAKTAADATKTADTSTTPATGPEPVKGGKSRRKKRSNKK